MKKVFLVLAVIAITATASGQAKFGIKAGLNFAKVGIDESESYSEDGYTSSYSMKSKALTAPLLGFFARLPMGEAMAFQPELLFSMQGSSVKTAYDIEGYSASETEDLKASYFILPLMFKYYVTPGLNIQAGPQLGYLLSAKVSDEDVKEEIENFDFGLTFGAGYDLDMGIGFDLRYNYGLTKVLSDDEGMNGSNKNGVFSIAISYAF